MVLPRVSLYLFFKPFSQANEGLSGKAYHRPTVCFFYIGVNMFRKTGGCFRIEKRHPNEIN